MVENVSHMGFKKTLTQNLEGFDYEHSVLAIAALGRFHATSYCFRKEKKVDICLSFPSTKKIPSAPKISKEAIFRLEVIFKESSAYTKYSKLFLSAAKGEQTSFGNNLEHFGVLCHGYVCKENVLFKYSTEHDSKLVCTELIFQDLSKSYYGSCVLDLLQFIFTSIDLDVRDNFMADLVCSVYYDSFAKTVTSINNNIAMFSKKDFIKEFDLNIMYGFLFSLDIHSNLYQEALDKDKVTAPSFVKHKHFILALVRDILQFKINAKATIC